jgi:hypothetical protein
MVRSYGCSRCGAGHDLDAWNALALSHRIEPVEVRRLVSDWPDDRCIEVRVCGSCASLIAVRCHWAGDDRHE